MAIKLTITATIPDGAFKDAESMAVSFAKMLISADKVNTEHFADAAEDLTDLMGDITVNHEMGDGVQVTVEMVDGDGAFAGPD